MNKDQNETLRYTRNEAARDTRATASDVARMARHLSEDMDKLSRNLKEEGPDALFNELGELQGHGVALDVALGKLYEKNRHLKSIDNLIEQLKELEGT